jgi:hypothetical protein
LVIGHWSLVIIVIVLFILILILIVIVIVIVNESRWEPPPNGNLLMNPIWEEIKIQKLFLCINENQNYNYN